MSRSAAFRKGKMRVVPVGKFWGLLPAEGRTAFHADYLPNVYPIARSPMSSPSSLTMGLSSISSPRNV